MTALPEEAGMWVPETTASKLGPVPVLYIGRTREESLSSCIGCKLLDDRECYAQFGSPSWAHASMIAASLKGKTYTLAGALLKSRREAKMVRISAVGNVTAFDPSVVFRWVKAIQDFGLQLVGYIHLWRENPQYAGVFMASCDDLSEVDEALETFGRAAVVLPYDFKGRTFTTPGGAKGIVCPAIVNDKVTCNTCRLCDASKPGPVIGFPNHGPKYRSKLKKLKLNKPNLTAKQKQAIQSLTGGNHVSP